MIGYQCILSSKQVYDCYIYNNNQECSTCKYGFIPFSNQCLLPDEIQAIQTGVKNMTAILLEKKNKYDSKYGAQIVNNNSTQNISQQLKIDHCKVIDQANKICALC